MRTPQKEGTLISTSSMASITSKENVLVSNYTNKHITFNKREYIGCLEPAIEDSATSDIPSHAQPDTHSTIVSPPKE